ncbi:MAG: 50S ribosomal protein L29 [Chromatiales bacterium]|jgi:large subunit ribosomal protein L29|nr:50S ribosomal protein L29 [Chromatiales bacterium]MDX9765889.1 50S ribosomal protein L29 [Ectothiorhodospiraceae bacterium]
MNAKELRQKSVEDLKKELLDIRREQFSMRMQRGVGQAPRPHQFGNARKTIARIKTILNERSAAGE